MGTTQASVPPEIIAFAMPRRIISNETPMASAPLEQAEVVQKLGPLAPKRIERWPEAMSAIIMGMKNGLTRPAPRSSMRLC